MKTADLLSVYSTHDCAFCVIKPYHSLPVVGTSQDHVEVYSHLVHVMTPFARRAMNRGVEEGE